MAEKVGLIAVLELSQFNRSFSQYTRSISQMNSQTAQTASGMSNSFTNLGDGVLSLATKIGTVLVGALLAAGTATAAFVASGISQAANLEAQLDGVNAILGITEEQGLAVKDAILELGIDPKLKVTASEAAQAVELLARNGLSVNEIIGESGDIMDSAAFAAILLANATGADFGKAADIATDAMAVFNIEAKDMVGVVDSIVGVTNNSKFTINDFALALRNGGAAAASMGIDLNSFNTAVAASAEELGTGMRAGTGFRAFITRLTPNTNVAADAMRELGFVTAQGNNIFFDSTGQLKDMGEVTKILNQALFGTHEITSEVNGRTTEQNKILAELTSQYGKAQETLFEYENGLKGITLSDETRNKKIEEQQALMALLAPRIEELNGIRGELVTTTSKLTDEERSMALESIFGADALGTVLALAKEGAPAFESVEEAMRELNITQEEAQELLDSGATSWDILYNSIAQTDSVDQAAQRMDNFKGVLEIIKGIIETVQIQIGDAFLPILTQLGEGFKDIVSDVGPKVVTFFQTVAGFITEFVQSLIEGQLPLESLTDALDKIGLSDVSKDIQKFITTFKKFVDPIIEFVREHSNAFIGAIKGIGAVLVSSAILAILVNIGGAILALINPITLIIGAFAALGAGIQTNFAGLGDAYNNIIESIQNGTITLESVLQNIGMVFGNLWAMVEPTLTEFVTNITTWFVETDWLGLATQAVDFIITGFGLLGTKVGEIIANLAVNLITWLNSVDWTEVGANVVNAIGIAIVASLGYLATAWLSLFNFAKSYITSQDWPSISANVLQAIFTALMNFGEGAFEVLAGWYQTFVIWFESVDWQAIGLGIIEFIITALSNFGAFVAETLSGWWQTFVDWTASIDWKQLGLDIINFIIDGLDTFVTNIVTTLNEWETSFVTWFNGIDWYQLGYDVVTFIIDGYKTFNDEIPKTLQTWFEEIADWFSNIDWTQLALDVVEFLLEGLAEFQEDVEPKLEEWWTAISDWFASIDWGQLGKDLVQGVINGIASKAGDIASAIGGLIAGAVQAAKDAAGIQSPSKVTEDEIGKPIVEGIAKGIIENADLAENSIGDLWDKVKGNLEELFDGSKYGVVLGQTLAQGIIESAATVGEALTGLFDVGGDLGSLGSAFVKRFKDTTLEPLEQEIDHADSIVEAWGSSLVKSLGLKDITELRANFGSITLQARADGNENLLRQLDAFVDADSKRFQLAKQYAEQQEKILELQKAQQDLNFLEQQTKLLDLITEHGLNAADILQGLELGINADAGGLVDAMTRAIQAIVAAAEGELQIASPSKVFENIGKFTLQGFGKGILEQSKNTMNSMRDVTRGIINSVTGGGSSITNNNQQNRSFTFDINNSFASQPQVTDRSQLELLLASFV